MLENISWEFLVLAALSYDILRRHHCLYIRMHACVFACVCISLFCLDLNSLLNNKLLFLFRWLLWLSLLLQLLLLLPILLVIYCCWCCCRSCCFWDFITQLVHKDGRLLAFIFVPSTQLVGRSVGRYFT